MLLPLVVIAAAAVLGWLSVFDRTSTLAISVVEVESSFGFALWIPFAIAGAALVVARVFGARPAPPPARRPLTRDAARTHAVPAAGGHAPGGGAGWLETVRAGARAVSDDAMGRVRFDEAAGVPIVLVLTAVTREQARRRVAAYAAWLATIPAPPTARVRIVSSPDLEGPIAGVLRGEIAKHFPGDAARVVSTHDGADAVFSHPDPRWSA